MEANELRELQNRGRFFWEGFPGAKASDEWTRDRDRSEELVQHMHRPGGRPADPSTASSTTPLRKT